MSRYYRICPDCGAHLDSGERCECRQEYARKELIAAVLQMPDGECAALLEMWRQRKNATALQRNDGQVERDLHDHCSTSNDSGK